MIRSRHHREEAAEAQQEDRETGPFFMDGAVPVN